MHDRAGSCVLQEHPFIWIKMFLHAKGSQRRFVKTAENKFFLSGIRIDITHRKNAWHVGLEFFSVYTDLAFVDIQSPLGNGSEIG